jgi:hypothetical protein
MKKRNKYLILILFYTLFQSCSNNDAQVYIKISLEEKARIGLQSGDENEIIGLPSDFVVDEEGNVYVADMAFRKIKKYSSSGKFLLSFGRGQGKGPGEFLDLRGIDVDAQGNLFVVDMKQNRVTIFNNHSNLVDVINTKFQPAFVRAFSTQRIYIIGFPFTYKGDLIYQYDLSKSNDEPVKIFCTRYQGADQFEIENTGMLPLILKDQKRETIFISDFYPYRTRAFDKNHNFLYELKREVDFFEPPYIKRKNPLYVIPVSGIFAIARLNRNILINMLLFRNETKEKIELFLDFWDIDKRKFLGCFSEEELGINIGRYVYADADGYFYNYEHDPYPHITKYKINITNK